MLPTRQANMSGEQFTVSRLRAFNGDLHLGQTEEYHRNGIQLMVSIQNASAHDVARVGIAGGPVGALDLEDAIALRVELNTITDRHQTGKKP